MNPLWLVLDHGDNDVIASEFGHKRSDLDARRSDEVARHDGDGISSAADLKCGDDPPEWSFTRESIGLRTKQERFDAAGISPDHNDRLRPGFGEGSRNTDDHRLTGYLDEGLGASHPMARSACQNGPGQDHEGGHSGSS